MRLHFTAQAARDLSDIAEYIHAENPAAAERVCAAILESLHILAEFPNIGRPGCRPPIVERAGPGNQGEGGTTPH